MKYKNKKNRGKTILFFQRKLVIDNRRWKFHINITRKKKQIKNYSLHWQSCYIRQ